jgi:hypothetical protein
MSAAIDISRLRAELEERFGAAAFPKPHPAERPDGGFAFGVAPLDSLLPGGVPRGALSLWTGHHGSAGRAAALRAVAVQASTKGARVAVVDADRALEASAWCQGDGPLAGVWVVRAPRSGLGGEAAWVAEALLRSGACPLVAVHGGQVQAAEAHRLRAIARERDLALVISLEEPAGIRADVVLEFRHESLLLARGRYRGRVRVRLAKNRGLPGGEREVESGIDAPDRLRPTRPVRDRAAPRR